MKLTDICEMDLDFGGEQKDTSPTKFDLKIHVARQDQINIPHGAEWIATLDDYDGAPDAGDHPVGMGGTPVDALDDLRHQAHETHPEFSEASMTAAFEREKAKYAGK